MIIEQVMSHSWKITLLKIITQIITQEITQNNFWKKVSHQSFENSLSVDHNLSVDNVLIQG